MLRKAKKDETLPALGGTVLALLHGGYWLLYLLLLAVVFALAQTQFRKAPPDLRTLWPLVVLCVAPNLISFYAFYFLLFPRFLARRKLFALVAGGALACLVSALSGILFSLVFFGSGQAIFADAREFLSLAASLFAIAAIHGAVALVVRGFVAWFAELKLREELARKSFEMELALVKSQINPHFLFNTLNNIDVLIAKDAVEASLYLNRLSDILRYMVYETKLEKIPLARELAYLEKYLALQKIRTVNRDYVDFSVTGAAGSLAIAPTIFFPFVENAFKHTEHRKTSSAIRVKISIEKERIVFECENSYQRSADAKQDFGGLGNELIKKRLGQLYPENHRLEIDDDGRNYRVRLTLTGVRD